MSATSTQQRNLAKKDTGKPTTDRSDTEDGNLDRSCEGNTMNTASLPDSEYAASIERVSYSSGASNVASPPEYVLWDSTEKESVAVNAVFKRPRRVQCPVCLKFYASKKSLKIHNRIHTGFKPYKCHLCPKSFSQTNVLKAHINAHNGQRDWECQICHKWFTQSAHLRTHEKTHFNRKDFHCDHCEKSFSSKGVRDRHTRQHTGEKPFHCGQCKKQFTRGESLRFHLNAHRGIRPYPCLVANCLSNFTKQSSLKRHFKACHTQPTSEKMEDAGFNFGVIDFDAIKNMSPGELQNHFAHTGELLDDELHVLVEQPDAINSAPLTPALNFIEESKPYLTYAHPLAPYGLKGEEESYFMVYNPMWSSPVFEHSAESDYISSYNFPESNHHHHAGIYQAERFTHGVTVCGTDGQATWC